MDIEQLYNAILNGRAILISGSGINAASKNGDGEQIPMGTSLAEELYELAEVDDPDSRTDLQDASENYIKHFSEAKLIAYLQRRFSVSYICDAARIIYTLPWFREYTTNYDNLPIICNRDVVPVTVDLKPKKYKNKDEKLCIYINGYLGSLTEDKFKSSFKLTTQSYLSAEGILNSQWGEVFREDLARASAIVIVGLSLDYDLDLRRIINESAKDKVVFVEREGIKQNKKDKLGTYGNVFDIGIDRFAQGIDEYRKKCFVEDKISHTLVNFIQTISYDKSKKVDSMMIRDLLMWGKLDPALLERRNDGSNNIIYRNDVERIIECVEEDNKRAVFIHSNLGNGKTVLLEQLKRKLFDLGIRCYEYHYKAFDALIDDIEIILSTKGKKVIIIENYFNHLDLLRKMRGYQLDDTTFILSARTMIYDTKLFDAIAALEITEGQSEILDINKLDSQEIAECYSLFENNGFWGKYTREQNEKIKKKVLTDKRQGDSQLRSILLEVIRSQEIQERLLQLINTINEKSGIYYKCIIMMLLSTVMSLELSVEDIQSILGISCISDPYFKENEAVKELVSIDLSGSMDYRIRSSIVANEILGLINSNEDIINTLIEISNYADKYYTVSEKYEGILKNTVSFSHVRTFLCNKRDNISFIIQYYEALKSVNFHKGNSFFWLQYSIACMHYGDFDLAQRFVEVAYDLFRSNGMTIPFQCDNQQARIKLLMISKGVSKDPIKDFKEAHSLAMLPCRNEKDREESVIRLFKLYTDKKLIRVLQNNGCLDLYRKACSEAYNRVNEFLRKLRNEGDRERYSELSRHLLRNAHLDD